MKTIIITGASSGIGKAIADLFASRNFNLVINSSNAGLLRRTWEEMGSPVNVKLVAGDISQKATAEAIVNTAIEAFGRVDALVNNAGVFAPKPFLDSTEEELDRFWAVNFKGTYFASQQAVKAMLNNGGGAIVNIGTVLVDHAIGGFPASAPVSSKGAVHALTRQLAAEFGKQNIRVNTIAPGIIRSPLQGKIGVQEADSLAGLHLLNRIGETADIAELTWHLVNSNFISGEIINADGGHVAGHHIG
jgi:NAD(P)-dependent dehydrogenase (short-subunit alcohol dehydrogenase family)